MIKKLVIRLILFPFVVLAILIALGCLYEHNKLLHVIQSANEISLYDTNRHLDKQLTEQGVPQNLVKCLSIEDKNKIKNAIYCEIENDSSTLRGSTVDCSTSYVLTSENKMYIIVYYSAKNTSEQLTNDLITIKNMLIIKNISGSSLYKQNDKLFQYLITYTNKNDDEYTQLTESEQITFDIIYPPNSTDKQLYIMYELIFPTDGKKYVATNNYVTFRSYYGFAAYAAAPYKLKFASDELNFNATIQLFEDTDIA